MCSPWPWATLASLQGFPTHTSLLAGLGWKYSLRRGSAFTVCLSPATCFLLNTQQLAHFQLGSALCIKPVSLYFLQEFPTVPKLSKQQQSPFPLWMGMLLACKNGHHACWAWSVSPKWGCSSKGCEKVLWKGTFSPKSATQPKKNWLQAGALIKCFIFTKPDRDTDCKMGRWVQVSFFW